jgi:hypothetical protein
VMPIRRILTFESGLSWRCTWYILFQISSGTEIKRCLVLFS